MSTTGLTMPYTIEDIAEIIGPNWEKTALFIDGANCYGSLKAIGINCDYARLRKTFSQFFTVNQVFYYSAVITDTADTTHVKIQPLLDWLAYNNFVIVSKDAKRVIRPDGSERVKGNMDIEIAVDAMAMAETGLMNHAIFFTGDGDFTYLVSALQKKGIRVTVVSTIVSKPAFCADELRKQANHFIELATLREHINLDRGYDNAPEE